MLSAEKRWQLASIESEFAKCANKDIRLKKKEEEEKEEVKKTNKKETREKERKAGWQRLV